MKRLMLMRHGEAQNAAAGQDDHSRPLTRKGRQDVKRIHDILRAEKLMPQLALASDASRTQATLIEITGSDFTGTIELTPELYNAEAEKIIETAQLLNDQYDSALIIAHNPGIYMAVLRLIDTTQLLELRDRLDHYRPGTLTILECPIVKWVDLQLQKNNLMRLFVPE